MKNLTKKELTEKLNSLEKQVDTLQVLAEESKKTKAKLLFFNKITNVIATAKNFNCALYLVMKTICEFTRWNYVESWVPNTEGTFLECNFICFSNLQKKLSKFKSYNKKITFAKNAGLPGRV